MATVRWSPDQSKVAVVNAGKISLWDIEKQEVLSVLEDESISCMDWSPFSEMIAFASGDEIFLWDTSNPSHVQRLVQTSYTFSDIAWSPDGETIAGITEDWEGLYMTVDLKGLVIGIWEAGSGQNISTLDPTPYMNEVGYSRVNPLAWSPDVDFIAAGTWPAEVIIWDTNTGAHIASFQGGHDYNVDQVTWSPDGMFLASGAWDNSIAIWDVHSGERILVLEGHKGYIKALAWSYDGKTLAVGSANSVYLWNPVSGELQDILNDHKDSVMDIAWTLDGSYLASASIDGSVILWEMK